MKMEVLSVQNHIQGQFGVIGTTKVKDWTSPLTPPPALPPPAPPIQQQQQPQQQQPQQQQQQQQQHQQQQQKQQRHQIAGVKTGGNAMEAALHLTDGHHHQQQQHHHHHHHHHHNVAGGAAGTAAHAPTYMTNVLASNAAAAAAAGATTATTTSAATFSTPPSPLQSAVSARFGATDNLDDVNAAAVHELSQRLQAELRAAKSRHLSCTEVTLPYDLTPRIAAEIIRMSEREPCGERACTIFIEFESEPSNVRRIASFKVDPTTVSIFELYLTLKQDKSGWTSLLPQFLKNLTRSNTIMISPDFTLTKNKLYSSE